MEERDKLRIVVDAMGGDYAPKAPVEGALLALEKYPDLTVILTGTREKVEEELRGHKYDASRLILQPTTQVIENEEESPVNAVRHKKDSSMSVGLRMVKNKEADGFVSAGNTGAVLAGGTFIVGRIPGVKRPALGVPLPSGKTPTMVLDCGANMDCRSLYLVQFAKMGSIYMEKQYGLDKARVGLLNVGAEPTKGNELVKETYQLLEQDPSIHFTGNCEGRDVFSGQFDVVVCDGFAGNVFLKGVEGTAGFAMSRLKSGIKKNPLSVLGAGLMMPVLKNLKNSMDPRKVGGTPLLGVDGAVIKAHGNSRGEAFLYAIAQAMTFCHTGINDAIRQSFREDKASE